MKCVPYLHERPRAEEGDEEQQKANQKQKQPALRSLAEHLFRDARQVNAVQARLFLCAMACTEFHMLTGCGNTLWKTCSVHISKPSTKHHLRGYKMQ